MNAPAVHTVRKSGPIENDFQKVNNPSAGDVHVNRPLTNMSQKYLQNEMAFIATRAFPSVPVKKQSNQYYIFDRDDFFRDDVKKRADGSETAGSGFKLSTDTYFCDVWGYHKDVSDRQRDNADEAVGPDRSATQFVTQKHLIRRERDFAETFFAASIWTSESTPANLWDTVGGTPIKDIRDKQRSVQANTGFRPNKMVLGREAWDALQDSDDLLSRITGGATTDMPASVKKKLIAALLELDAIFVMDGIVTTSVEGAATPVRAFIGGNHALLYYAPETAGLEQVSAGMSFNWTGSFGNSPNGMRMKRFRMENLASDRLEGEMSFDHKITGIDLGHFFDSVTS